MESRLQFSLGRMLYAMTWMSVAAAALAIGIQWTGSPTGLSIVGDLLIISAFLIFGAGVGVLFKHPWLGAKYLLAGWGAVGVLVSLVALFAWLFGL